MRLMSCAQIYFLVSISSESSLIDSGVVPTREACKKANIQPLSEGYILNILRRDGAGLDSKPEDSVYPPHDFCQEKGEEERKNERFVTDQKA